MAENRETREEHELHLPELEHPEVHHEEKDVNVWAVGKFAIALVLICIAALFILFGLFRYFQAREAAVQAPLKPGVNIDARRLPPAPRLQDAPILDLKQMRDAEDQILGSYGWVDRQNGTVRIPIDRAIDLLAQRGLPSRSQAGPQTAAPDVSVPSESGLGPKMLPPGGPLNSTPEPGSGR